MFFSKIYKSWEDIQERKYKQIVSKVDIKNKKILDIGSGDFYLEKFLAKKGIEADITALDIEKHAGVPFIIADGNELPIKDSAFDMIISIDTMHLIKTNDFKRVLKENGLVLFSIFFNKQNYEEKKSMLKEKLKDFEIVDEFEIKDKENEYFIIARKTTSSPMQ
jgi:ubiquinone/menaquinone biosynthesis C-methylase UbiE